MQILHSHIASIERLSLTAAGSPLKIRTKNFNVVTFVISRERDCSNVYATLLEFSSPSKYMHDKIIRKLLCINICQKMQSLHGSQDMLGNGMAVISHLMFIFLARS